MIETGVLIYTNLDPDGSRQYVLANKFIRGKGDSEFVGIVIREDSKGNKYYTHTISQKNNWMAKSQSEKQNDTLTLHPDISMLIQNMLYVNDSEICQMIDATVSPLSRNGKKKLFISVR